MICVGGRIDKRKPAVCGRKNLLNKLLSDFRWGLSTVFESLIRKHDTSPSSLPFMPLSTGMDNLIIGATSLDNLVINYLMRIMLGHYHNKLFAESIDSFSGCEIKLRCTTTHRYG